MLLQILFFPFTFSRRSSGRSNSADFLPNGNEIVTRWNNAVRIWDANSGRELRTLRHENWQTVALSPDGKKMITLTQNPADRLRDEFVKIFDAVSGKELHTLKGHTDWVSSAAFFPDGTLSQRERGRCLGVLTKTGYALMN